MKTNSSAKKRFKVTGSGKIKRNRAGTQHMLRNKSKKSKLHLSHSTVISHKGDEKRIKKLLNI